MNRRQTPRPSPAGFTPQQKWVLILAGLLVMAWVVVGIVFLLSGGVSGAGAAPNPAQADPLTTQPPASHGGASGAESTITPAALISISAACAQTNSGAQEGVVTRVGDDGSLEVNTTDGTVQFGFGGIELLPGSKALDILQETVAGQPVLLVRDLSSQAAAGQPQRYIFTREQFVNYELVRQGLAVVNLDSPDRSCAVTFQLAEQKARSERQGMWEPTRAPTLTFVPQVTLDTSSLPSCDCSIRYECSDFTTHAEAQACYNTCNDYNSRLDLDRNGIACEELR